VDEQPVAESNPEQRLAALFGKPEAAPQTVEPEAPQASNDAPEAEVEEPEVPEDDGNDDVDLDGLTLRVPKEAKAKIEEYKQGKLRQDDYTRKTQELADITRQNQAVAEAISLRQAFDKETTKEREELSRITADLERYKAVDWQNLDVDTYIKLKGQMDSHKEKAEELKESINAKAKDFTEKTEKQKQTAAEEGRKFLQKVVPGFGKDQAEAAYKAALSGGYTGDELKNVHDARFLYLSWKAAQYDKIQEGKSAAVASVQKAPPVVKPGASVPGATAERRYSDARKAMKKDGGSLKSTAAAFLARGLK